MRIPGVDVRFAIIRIASTAALFTAWEWYGSQPGQFALPPPSKVFPALVESIVDGGLVQAAIGTLWVGAVGFSIAAVLGVTLGLVIANVSWADNTLTPLVNAAYAAPITMLVPIIGIYTGLGFTGKVTLVVLFAFFVILINTEAGVRQVREDLVETARSFEASRIQIARHVMLPSTMPFILNGLRLGVGRAVRGAIVAELLLLVSNLGLFLIRAGATFNMPRLMAGIFFTMLMGYAVMWFAGYLERRSLRWRGEATY
ncbi:MAG: ABC transporter permease [Chloroflexi bacterium]|nr:ABC transporter permease [Chloroflexota bacterium]